jgi:hypothetical protein
LIGGTLLLWVVVVYPAHLAWGTAAILQSATAMGLCLVPTAATLLWAGWAQGGSPARQLGFVLGGTGVRMAVVLAGGLALSLAVPGFREPDQTAFWAWVLVFYLVTLAIEVTLLYQQLKRSGDMGMAK